MLFDAPPGYCTVTRPAKERAASSANETAPIVYGGEKLMKTLFISTMQYVF